MDGIGSSYRIRCLEFALYSKRDFVRNSEAYEAQRNQMQGKGKNNINSQAYRAMLAIGTPGIHAKECLLKHMFLINKMIQQKKQAAVRLLCASCTLNKDFHDL